MLATTKDLQQGYSQFGVIKVQQKDDFLTFIKREKKNFRLFKDFEKSTF